MRVQQRLFKAWLRPRRDAPRRIGSRNFQLRGYVEEGRDAARLWLGRCYGLPKYASGRTSLEKPRPRSKVGGLLVD